MNIGDRVIVYKNKQKDESAKFGDKKKRKGVIIGNHNNYYVVKLGKGYNECFRANELVLVG